MAMIIESTIIDLNPVFIINLIIAFIVGGLWVTLAIYTAEKFGSRIGGFISGLPSTAVVSYFFIGITQTPQAASDATTVFPLSFVITGLFLLIYAILAKKVFISAFIMAFAIWIILSISNKGIFPNALIKEIKNTFKRSEEFLDLEMQTDEQLKMQQDNETRNTELATTSESEYMQGQTIQMLTKLDQVEEMISKGWRLVATIPENRQ